jgi:hypothetical protein
MRRNPGNATANARFELQEVIGEILRKHRIDPSVHNYDLRLRMPTYIDPLIGRADSYESSGQDGDLILFVKKMWEIHKDGAVGDIVCYYFENGRRMMYPDKIEEFMSIQRMFAQKIKGQGWLDSGMRLKRK